MARTVLKHVVERAGRDKGKIFICTEMSAVAAHDWATRALFALMNTGAELPDEIGDLGMAGIAAAGFKALSKIPHAVGGPLLKELLTCAKIQPSESRPDLVREIFETDFEEFVTIFDLQKVILQMHVAPFTQGGESITASPPQATAGSVS